MIVEDDTAPMSPEEMYRIECAKRRTRLPTGGELHTLIGRAGSKTQLLHCPKCKCENIIVNHPARGAVRRKARKRTSLRSVRCDCADCGYSWRSSRTDVQSRWTPEVSGGSMSNR